jgi:predicted nucleic acid-binding protein
MPASKLPSSDAPPSGRGGPGIGFSQSRGPARFFIDTNIFIYTFDDTSPVRQAKARELVELGLTTGLGVVSYQVVQEFLNVATSRFATPLDTGDSRTFLERVLAPMWRVSPTLSLYSQAFDIRSSSGYGFYDSLIVAAALVAGCRTLYTEDLQHGRRFDQLVVVDPFQ